MATPHPLEQLRAVEIDNAREFIIAQFPSCMIRFRSIHLEEPAKAELIEFLIAEHDGTLGESTSRPPRLARAQYDVVDANKKREYVESVVDVQSKKEVSRETIDASVQAALTV
jgi:primary-amine oxidase